MAEGDTPPIGYGILGGAWLTDAVRDTTYSVFGNSSVKFENTNPNPGGNTYLLQSIPTPCEAGELFLVEMWTRASGTNANTQAFAGAAFWDKDLTPLASQWPISWVTFAASDTWYKRVGVMTAPATAAMMESAFGRKSDATDDIWIDSFVVTRFSYRFSATNTGQAVNKLTGTKVQFDTEIYDYGGVFDAAADYSFVAPVDGIYLVTARLSFSTATSAACAGYLYLTNGIGTVRKTLDKNYWPAGAQDATLTGTTFIELVAGDVLEIWTFHTDTAASMNTSGGAQYGEFSVMLMD